MSISKISFDNYPFVFSCFEGLYSFFVKYFHRALIFSINFRFENFIVSNSHFHSRQKGLFSAFNYVFRKKKSEFFDKDDIVEFCRFLVPLMVMMMEMFISIIVVLSCLLWLLRWMDDEPTPGGENR